MILECKSVSKSYVIKKRKRSVLKDVSFSLGQGEIITINGSSGAGKSTLLGLLAGLDRHDDGTIHLFNNDISLLTESHLARLRKEKIGIIFQNYNLIPSWSALENVEAVLAYRGMSRNAMREKAGALLTQLGLGDLLDNLPVELSAGEQQRVAVARTLVHKPLLILADEPVADVDPETGVKILTTILKAVGENGTTVVLATHGVPPEGFSQRVLTIKNGYLS